MKFCFRLKKGKDTLEDTLEGIDIPQLYDYLQSLRSGTRMHLIVRPLPGFDVEGMRNYFHGPMLDSICNAIKSMFLFWAFDKHTGKRADQTGQCICLATQPWAIYALDAVGCERVFSRHLFRFEVIE